MCRNLAIFGQNLVEFWVHKGTFWLYHGVPLKFSSVNKESSVLR